MPVMDGFEAARGMRRFEQELREKTMSQSAQNSFRPTFIAALTGLDSAEAQKESVGSGINTVLIKPVKRPELQAILQQYAKDRQQ